MRRSLTVAVATATMVAMALGGGSAFAGRSSAIPNGFQAQSVSFVSPQQGWLLGTATCTGGTCTTVLGTTDGGTTWNSLGTLKAPVSLEEPSAVSEVRFADDLDGWAFEPALWATTDGGSTWQRQAPPGGGHLVLALAADAEAAYVLVSPCRLNQLCNDPPTLWQATPGQGSWTQVSLTLPVFNYLEFAILAVHGVVAYLGVPSCLYCPPRPDLLDVTTDGQQWSSRPDPCMVQDQEFLAGVTAISDSDVALLCLANPGFGKADKRVLRSNDTGQTTYPAGSTPEEGIVSQLVATPNGTLVVSSFAIESWIYRNAGGQTWTTPVEDNDAGQGWNDIMFASDLVGFVIHAPVFCCGGHGTGELWETEDGGVTWAPV